MRKSTMSRIQYRSFFWPIMLIGVGIVWLLGNVGIINAANLSVLFNIWPIFLIAIGLDLLFGRRSVLLGATIGLGTLVLVIGLMFTGPSIGLATAQLETNQQAFSEPLEDAQSATVNLGLSVGEASVYALADSNDLIAADLTYVGEVNLEASGTTHKTINLGQVDGVSISLPGGIFLPFNQEQDLRWNIGLSPELPLDLTIESGVGRANLDLSELDLSALTVSSGVGETFLLLPASSEPYAATVNNGVGETTITIAEGAALDLTLDGGIGSVVIDVPDNAALHIEASGGLGEVHVPDGLAHNQASGDYDVWESPGFASAESPITINFSGGIGGLTIR
jgi:hypothetical protein